MLPEYLFKLTFLVPFVFAVMAIVEEIRVVGEKIESTGKQCIAYTFTVPMEDLTDDFELLDEVESYKGN